jgi:hypothetical protein
MVRASSNCHANLLLCPDQWLHPLFSPLTPSQPASRRTSVCGVTADAVGDAAEDPAPRACIASVSVIAETSVVMSAYTFTPPLIPREPVAVADGCLGPRSAVVA